MFCIWAKYLDSSNGQLTIRGHRKPEVWETFTESETVSFAKIKKTGHS